MAGKEVVEREEAEMAKDLAEEGLVEVDCGTER